MIGTIKGRLSEIKLKRIYVKKGLVGTNPCINLIIKHQGKAVYLNRRDSLLCLRRVGNLMQMVRAASKGLLWSPTFSCCSAAMAGAGAWDSPGLRNRVRISGMRV